MKKEMTMRGFITITDSFSFPESKTMIWASYWIKKRIWPQNDILIIKSKLTGDFLKFSRGLVFRFEIDYEMLSLVTSWNEHSGTYSVMLFFCCGEYGIIWLWLLSIVLKWESVKLWRSYPGMWIILGRENCIAKEVPVVSLLSANDSVLFSVSKESLPVECLKMSVTGCHPLACIKVRVMDNTPCTSVSALKKVTKELA